MSPSSGTLVAWCMTLSTTRPPMTAVCRSFTVRVVVAPRSVKSMVPRVPCGPLVPRSEMVSCTSRRTSSDSSMCGVTLICGPIFP